MPLASLCLLHHPHRLALDAYDAHAADEEALVYPRAPSIGIVARAKARGPVEAQSGADGRVGEVKGQPKFVAGGEQVRSRVYVRDNVVRGLGGQGGK